MAHRDVELIVPGLFGLGLSLDMVLSGVHSSPNLALTHLMARGDVAAIPPGSPEQTVCRRLGESPDILAHGEAQLAWFSYHEALCNAGLLLLDPVYLDVGRRGLTLTATPSINVSTQELRSLASVCAPVSREFGFELLLPEGGRQILLRHERQLELIIPTLWQVLADGIGTQRVSGVDAQVVAKLRNAIEMALHDCPFNAERAARGERPINSVWLWGTPNPSCLPRTKLEHARAPRHHRRRVITDSPIIAGIGKLVGVNVDLDLDHWRAARGDVVVLDGGRHFAAHGAIESWIAWLDDFNLILQKGLFDDKSRRFGSEKLSDLLLRRVRVVDTEGACLTYPTLRQTLMHLVKRRDEGLYSQLRRSRQRLSR